MPRKKPGPMDVNQYYSLMGQRPESEAWEMPIYNKATGGKLQPITGTARKAAGQNSGVFQAPKYNDASGKPIINESKSSGLYRPAQLKKSTGQAASQQILNKASRPVYTNNAFVLDIPDSQGFASFMKVSGIECEWEFESYLEGGNTTPYMLPKQINNSRLVLEYGTCNEDFLQTWFLGSQEGKIVRRSMTLTMLDQTRKPVTSWVIQDAFPAKYAISDFDALRSEVSITRLEFIHNGIRQVKK